MIGILVLRGHLSSNGICWRNRSATNNGRADDAVQYGNRSWWQVAPLLPMKPHLSMSARTDKPFEPVYTDADAQFYSDRHYDVSN